MAAWFASSADRRHDPRTLGLASVLGISRHEALGVIDCLYGWVADHVPSGDLAPFSDAAIASACDWPGAADALVTGLLEAGILTLDATIADWYDLFGRYARQREGLARRVARHRERDGNGSGNGVSNGVSNAAPPSPPRPPTPVAPPTGAAPSVPPGETGSSTPGQSSGPAPGARARAKAPPPDPVGAESRAVPKPTPTQVRLARIVDLVREAGVEIFPSARDGTALKACGAPADRIAEAYLAAARGEWDPGGDGWLGGNLSVHLVISRLAGYRPARSGASDYLETRYGRLRTAPIDDGAAAF